MGRRTITALRIGAIAVLLLMLASWGALASRSTRPPAGTVFRCLFGIDPPSEDVRIELFPSDPHLEPRQWTGYAIVKGSASQRAALLTDLGLDSDEARRDGSLFGVAAFACPSARSMRWCAHRRCTSCSTARSALASGRPASRAPGPSDDRLERRGHHRAGDRHEDRRSRGRLALFATRSRG